MPTELTPSLREQAENTIRFLSVEAVQRANSGHPGAPMGLARPAFLLWDEFLRFDPDDAQWPLRDRFVLSAGHASMLLYSLLHLFELGLSLDDIARFRQLGSRTPGHPEYGETPGVEVTTGPLGQGIAHGVGMALAARMTASRFGGGEGGKGPGDHFVYAIAGDGDMMEGISSEAGSLAGHLGLGNFIVLYDNNGITIDGGTDLCFSEDVGARFAAQGWQVQHCDGQDVEGLRAAIRAAQGETAKPSIIVTRTTIGYGSPENAGKNVAHGAPLGAEEIEATKRNLGWEHQGELVVPGAVRAYCGERAQRKRAEAAARNEELAAWRSAHADRAEAWDAARSRQLPANLGELLCEGVAGVDKATRQHSAAVLERLSELVPYLAGGSADLAGSGAPPIIKGRGIVGPGAGAGEDPFAGQNLHFGVREHAMGAVANGIALDGTLLPYCGTFLIFSDYMRPSIRLSALMGLRTIYVFTHDSIFVGEDGPTHQPVEQLDALRSIPGLMVFRPADGIETAMSYAWILERAEGPAMLSLTRQKVAALERPASFDTRDVWKGGYPVIDPQGRPDVVMIATGSEVSLACSAATKLAAAGVQARVVSIPCLELFAQQPESYQQGLIPDDGTPLVAVEAGLGESLRRWVGRRGLVYGMKGFGASAPAAKLAEHFGFTPEALATRVQDHIR